MSNDPVSVVVFAKRDADERLVREAQYDLLVRSLARNWPEAELVWTVDAPAGRPAFVSDFRAALESCGELVCFATDDGVFYRRVDEGLIRHNLAEPLALGHSLRLGRNTHYCYPSGLVQPLASRRWRWAQASGDFGYPFSLDGTVYRTRDVLEVFREGFPENPTALEATGDALMRAGAIDRPLLSSDTTSSYVCVPVNRVSEQSRVRAGTEHPQRPEELRSRYSAGEHIDLERTFAGVTVDSAHVELPFAWTPARVEA